MGLNSTSAFSVENDPKRTLAQGCAHRFRLSLGRSIRGVSRRKAPVAPDGDSHWFDMMPGVADVGHAQCRTADGVVLKDVQSIRGPLRNSLLAVRLSRSAVGLDAVLPPAAILAPATWGILD